jgi:hypothetical protein
MGSDKKKGRTPNAGKIQGKNPGGRPPLSDEARRDNLLRLLCTDDELAKLQDAAKYVSTPVSTWVRSVALEKARMIALEKARMDAEKAKHDG